MLLANTCWGSAVFVQSHALDWLLRDRSSWCSMQVRQTNRLQARVSMCDGIPSQLVCCCQAATMGSQPTRLSLGWGHMCACQHATQPWACAAVRWAGRPSCDQLGRVWAALLVWPPGQPQCCWPAWPTLLNWFAVESPVVVSAGSSSHFSHSGT